MSRLFTALSAHPEQVSANAIRFLALTGARKSEVLSARWEMFDLEAGVWTKPAAFTKQRKYHRVPLSAGAIAVLGDMRQISDGPFVFPGRVPDQPLTDIKRSWETVCREAELCEMVPRIGRKGRAVLGPDGHPTLMARPTARIHDLRHTFASLLVSGGKSLPLIGALLGHSQSQMTMRYAHLYDDAMREAADHVNNAIANHR
jgi:integrase